MLNLKKPTEIIEMLRHHWLLISAALLFVVLFMSFLDREPFDMPGKGAQQSELIDWLDARGYTIFDVLSASKNYNDATSEQIGDAKAIRNYEAREASGTLFTHRASSLRKSRLCWNTLRFVTWRSSQQQLIEEVHYSRSVCYF